MVKNSIKFSFFSIIAFLLTGCDTLSKGILAPKGLIAFQERALLVDAVALMLIVVIPVIIMSFAFIVRYRASHKTAEYRPHWSHSTFLEVIWWGIPCIIIVILGVMTWTTSHTLDPYRKIDVPGKPMLVEVVALPWKWLFIYPEQNIATVNELALPKDQQVEFWFTNDNVPMSSFFIPQLGSQIYTMAGMRTRLHLLPTENGTYEGLNSQYSGDGFSDMHFQVKVMDSTDFDTWVNTVKKSTTALNQDTLKVLTKPTIGDQPQYFAQTDADMFSQIINSYFQEEDPNGNGFQLEQKEY